MSSYDFFVLQVKPYTTVTFMHLEPLSYGVHFHSVQYNFIIPYIVGTNVRPEPLAHG